MLWRLGRIAEIAFFVRVVVEVGLFHTFVCFGGRDCSRNWLCVWGSIMKVGFDFDIELLVIVFFGWCAGYPCVFGIA